MNSLNLALFDALAAGASPPSAALLWLAAGIAQGSSWFCAAVLAMVAWRRASERWHVLAALAAGGAASLVSHEVAAFIGMPRPFMVGLSPLHVPHGARAGLPSTHATVMFTIAFMLLWRRPLRHVGLLVLAVAFLTGLARIHVGVHFPFDIAAGALLGAGICGALQAGHAAVSALAPRLTVAMARPWGLLASSGAAPCVALAFIGMAGWIGLAAPPETGIALLQENGPVENGTVQLYLVAALCFLALRLDALSRRDRIAVCAVLLGLAAREAHTHLGLHARMADWSFIAPAGIAACWLAARAWGFPQAGQRWRVGRPATSTLLTFVGVTAAATLIDQVAAPQATLSLAEDLSARREHLLLSLEEVLELALPVLALLAALQAQWAARASAAPLLRPSSRA